MLLLHILDDHPRHFKHLNTFLLSTNSPTETVKKTVLKPKNAKQFMLRFYFFPRDGKFGQFLTWPDHGSERECQIFYCTNRKLNLLSGVRGWYFQILPIFLETLAPSFQWAPKNYGLSHHFKSFQFTAKIPWQVFLALPENKEGEVGANKVHVTCPKL